MIQLINRGSQPRKNSEMKGVRFMEKLKELLGEELFKQVEAKLGTEKKYFFGEGEFIPKGRFDEVNNQNKELKTSLAERDTQLADLGEKAKGHEELTKKINELTETNKKLSEEYEAKIAAREREYAIDGELSKIGAKNLKAVKALLDNEKIVVKDGQIVGLNEQIETIKKSDAYLFNETQPTPPGKGGNPLNPPSGGGTNDFSDFIKM